MWVAQISQFSIPPHGTNRKVPPPWVEGAAFERRRYGLQEVVVYSREPQVRLYLNGQLVGTQSTSEMKVVFTLPYEPGILWGKAVITVNGSRLTVNVR